MATLTSRALMPAVVDGFRHRTTQSIIGHIGCPNGQHDFGSFHVRSVFSLPFHGWRRRMDPVVARPQPLVLSKPAAVCLGRFRSANRLCLPAIFRRPSAERFRLPLHRRRRHLGGPLESAHRVERLSGRRCRQPHRCQYDNGSLLQRLGLPVDRWRYNLQHFADGAAVEPVRSRVGRAGDRKSRWVDLHRHLLRDLEEHQWRRQLVGTFGQQRIRISGVRHRRQPQFAIHVIHDGIQWLGLCKHGWWQYMERRAFPAAERP